MGPRRDGSYIMPKRRKKHKIARISKVTKRRLRRLNRKKVLAWLEKKLVDHPFILGLLFLVWISRLIDILTDSKDAVDSVKALLKLDALIFLIWLVLVLISSTLKDKKPVKWYFKKRFVFILLLLVYPLGLIFLWGFFILAR